MNLAILFVGCAQTPFKSGTQSGTFVTVNTDDASNVHHVSVEVVTKSAQEATTTASQSATQDTSPNVSIPLTGEALSGSLIQKALPSIPKLPHSVPEVTEAIGKEEENAIQIVKEILTDTENSEGNKDSPESNQEAVKPNPE